MSGEYIFGLKENSQIKNKTMLTNDDFIGLGFIPVPTFTIGNGLTYELGRNRCLSASSVGTPNEMLFIYEHQNGNPTKINDIIVLHNYDYDDYITLDKLQKLVDVLESKEKKHQK